MNAALVHRGPDGSGFWEDGAKGLALGHRRLSIIDLSEAGAQPMASRDRSWVVVLNGEIYNHLDLRDYLQNAGYSAQWRGHSDTETLAGCLEFWGLEKTLPMLSGMFAFAAWHRETCRLVLVRDRFGEKPLYYAWSAEVFLFASELKAIRASKLLNLRVDLQALAEYFRLGCVPSPLAIYEKCRKLTPGHYLEVTYQAFNGKRFVSKAYWSLSHVIGQKHFLPRSDSEICDELEKHIHRAVREQRISDVPIGAFLSGGIDSSTIVALMQANSSDRVKTFTVGFDETGFDEAPYAQAVASHLGTDHHELKLTATDALGIVPNLPIIFDEPFADSSQIPTYWVSRAAKQDVTVALSGDGGDELFGGYNRHVWGDRIWSKFGWLPFLLRRAFSLGLIKIPRQGLNDFGDFLSRFMPALGVKHLGDKVHRMGLRLHRVRTIDELYVSLVSEWDDPALLLKGYSISLLPNNEGARVYDFDKSLLGRYLERPPVNLKSTAECMMFWDALTYLTNDILCKVDRAAMSVSLETRAPFLDHQLAAFAWALPINLKIRHGQGKWVLRQILYKYVPKHLVERPKTGFGIPLGSWLRGPLRDWAEDLLDERILEKQGYLHTAPIRKLWQDHSAGKVDHSQRIWSVLMFQAWLRAQQA